YLASDRWCCTLCTDTLYALDRHRCRRFCSLVCHKRGHLFEYCHLRKFLGCVIGLGNWCKVAYTHECAFGCILCAVSAKQWSSYCSDTLLLDPCSDCQNIFCCVEESVHLCNGSQK